MNKKAFIEAIKACDREERFIQRIMDKLENGEIKWDGTDLIHTYRVIEAFFDHEFYSWLPNEKEIEFCDIVLNSDVKAKNRAKTILSLYKEYKRERRANNE